MKTVQLPFHVIGIRISDIILYHSYAKVTPGRNENEHGKPRKGPWLGGRDFELKCDKTYPFNGAFATMLQWHYISPFFIVSAVGVFCFVNAIVCVWGIFCRRKKKSETKERHLSWREFHPSPLNKVLNLAPFARFHWVEIWNPFL